MRHVFLINPAAGKYDRTGEFTQTIRAACEGLDYEILVSRAPGDCTHIAQAAASSGEPVRLYACGGGAKSAAWLQIKADILGCEIIPVKSDETGAMGSAILGIAAVTGESPL